MKFNSNNLNERVSFCEDISKSVNGLPSRPKTVELYNCFACIQDSKETDTQTALSNESKFIKTIIVRDPRGDYKPSNKHYVLHEGYKYNIKYYKPDYIDKSFIRVYCEVTF
ncbi:head-tail adaptor protein [Mammaliicoccus sciuri]|uniref:head-tail adaptor protein n=1 Tax=Mammaliicoccus sciuri TaxID=1296 RepID=UPI000878A303|nr:head-tail adaptor protein [Mammaliicoccus sciuri]OFV61101.1 head-tail adaptor protein [Mammaliicoccus sciuri]